MNFNALLATDSNVAPAFRRIFASPKEGPLEVAHAKADVRRFAAEPVALTGFGGIDEIGSERWRDVRDQEQADQRADERRERIARGE